jgi:hypothetical protein
MPRLSGHDQPQLESDAFSLVSAYLDLHSVGAHNDNTKVFMPSIVWVDAESLIGHLEANPIACESSHDSGHVGIFALGAINCAYDTPSIMDAISRRWTIPSLGGCRAPAENDRYQEHREKQMILIEHDSLMRKLLQIFQKLVNAASKSELGFFHYLLSVF